MAKGDITLAHAASVDYTMDLDSLSTSSNRVVGRSSLVVSHGAWLDVLIAGKIKTGTSPTVNQIIAIFTYAAIKDDPLYPEDFLGTDADVTIASVEERDSALKLVHTIRINATTDVVYNWGPHSLAAIFGGVLPTHHGLWVSQSTGVDLDTTGHANHYTPVIAQVAQ